MAASENEPIELNSHANPVFGDMPPPRPIIEPQTYRLVELLIGAPDDVTQTRTPCPPKILTLSPAHFRSHTCVSSYRHNIWLINEPLPEAKEHLVLVKNCTAGRA